MKNEINALINQAMKEYDVELSQECIDNLSRIIENTITITCIQNKQNKLKFTIPVNSIDTSVLREQQFKLEELIKDYEREH